MAEVVRGQRRANAVIDSMMAVASARPSSSEDAQLRNSNKASGGAGEDEASPRAMSTERIRSLLKLEASVVRVLDAIRAAEGRMTAKSTRDAMPAELERNVIKLLGEIGDAREGKFKDNKATGQSRDALSVDDFAHVMKAKLRDEHTLTARDWRSPFKIPQAHLAQEAIERLSAGEIAGAAVVLMQMWVRQVPAATVSDAVLQSHWSHVNSLRSQASTAEAVKPPLIGHFSYVHDTLYCSDIPVMKWLGRRSMEVGVRAETLPWMCKVLNAERVTPVRALQSCTSLRLSMVRLSNDAKGFLLALQSKELAREEARNRLLGTLDKVEVDLMVCAMGQDTISRSVILHAECAPVMERAVKAIREFLSENAPALPGQNVWNAINALDQEVARVDWDLQ